MSFSTHVKMVGENIGLAKGLGLLLWLPVVSSSSEVKKNTGQTWEKTPLQVWERSRSFWGGWKNGVIP